MREGERGRGRGERGRLERERERERERRGEAQDGDGCEMAECLLSLGADIEIATSKNRRARLPPSLPPSLPVRGAGPEGPFLERGGEGGRGGIRRERGIG